MSILVEFTFVGYITVFSFVLTDCFLVKDGLQRVTTKMGEIHGYQISAQFDGQTFPVNAFLGIPYAEPPVGNLRFRKPVPLRHFPSPLKAFSPGIMCPQPYLMNATMSEDCLTLNVYAPFPHGADVLRKPVMIWIHGGGFFGGSSADYNAEVLAGFTDTIIVTINYRLGALGFFSTLDEESPGNYGLWDQHLAIRWVHENIASFGGDADNVTIFGESAGSSSVIFQTLFAGNRGLFQRAIAESGTLSTWAITDNNSVNNASIAFAKTLRCTDTNHAVLVSCMRSKSSFEIVKAVEAYTFSLDLHPSWIPVYDNDFVIEEPIHMLAHAQNGSKLYSFFHEVDLLIGWNNYDGCIYFIYWMSKSNITSPKNYEVSTDQLNNVYAPRIAEMGLAVKPTSAMVSRIREEYTKTADQMSSGERLDILGHMATDAFLAAPTIRTANAHATSASSTYIYRFSAKPPFRIMELPPYLDQEGIANHGDDLMFVFGMKPVVAFSRNQIPQPNVMQLRLSKAMMTMWSNFAKSGNPNNPWNVKQFYNTEWDKYEIDQPRYLEITSDMTPQSSKYGPSFQAVNFWNTLLQQDQKVSHN